MLINYYSHNIQERLSFLTLFNNDATLLFFIANILKILNQIIQLNQQLSTKPHWMQLLYKKPTNKQILKQQQSLINQALQYHQFLTQLKQDSIINTTDFLLNLLYTAIDDIKHQPDPILQAKILTQLYTDLSFFFKHKHQNVNTQLFLNYQQFNNLC